MDSLHNSCKFSKSLKLGQNKKLKNVFIGNKKIKLGYLPKTIMMYISRAVLKIDLLLQMLQCKESIQQMYLKQSIITI